MTNIKKKHSAEFKATVAMAAMRRIDEIYMNWMEPPGPGRNGERNFRNDRRSSEMHASATDPDARLSHATGTAEPEKALEMLGGTNKTVGADKNYDTAAFVTAAREWA